jgi:type IV secretory pathway TrbD component
MTALTAHQTDRLARKTELALTFGIALATIELLRRTPRRLLIVAGLLAYTLLLLAIVYILWLEAALAAVVAWKLGRGVVQGWREAR